MKRPIRLSIAGIGLILLGVLWEAQVTGVPAETSDDSPYGALLAQSARKSAGATYSARRLQAQLHANRRIVKGKPVSLGTYPWIVAIGYFEDTTFVQYCAGSIVAPEWVLTAAHCDVQVGDAVVTNVIDLSTVTKASALVHDLVPSPSPYNEATRNRDYRLLHLDRAVAVKPIELSQDSAFEVEQGHRFVIAGWGRTSYGGLSSDALLATAITTKAVKKCKGAYHVVPLELTDTMFCGTADKGDACQGDSGGPAMREIATNTYVLVGLVSWGKSCGQQAFPGVYTRASQITPDVEPIIHPARINTPTATSSTHRRVAAGLRVSTHSNSKEAHGA